VLLCNGEDFTTKSTKKRKGRSQEKLKLFLAATLMKVKNKLDD
jgi:hypothetical protein